jgi:predicted DNA binding protein
MRRLILEVQEKELQKIGIELPPFKKIKTLELLYFLRQDEQEFAAISQVEFKDPNSKMDDIVTSGLMIETQIIEDQKNGKYIVFMRGGPTLSSVLKSVGIQSGYLFPPLGISDNKIRFSFLGNEVQVQAFMERIDALAIRYRVVLLTDANFSPTSPLNGLTEKQRETLIAAYKLGYYDIPRKITSGELAEKLGLVNSTVVEHLRKAEKRLMAQILEQQPLTAGLNLNL